MRPQLLSICQETIVDLERAAHLMGDSTENVMRWAHRGIAGIKLESAYSKERRTTITSIEAIGRFLVAVGVKSLA